MVGGHAIHAQRLAVPAAPDVAAANQDRDLYLQRIDALDDVGHAARSFGLDAEPALAGERLAAQLEQDTMIFEFRHEGAP